MDLSLYLLDGFAYHARGASFPIVAGLCVERRMEISTKVDVRELTLTPVGASGEEEYFGRLSLPGIGKLDGSILLEAMRPVFFSYDVFGAEDGAPEGFLPGEYRLRVVLGLFGKGTDEGYHLVEAEKVVRVG